MLLNGYLKDGAVSINAEAELIIWEWSFRKYCKSFNWLLTNIQIDIYKSLVLDNQNITKTFIWEDSIFIWFIQFACTWKLSIFFPWDSPR